MKNKILFAIALMCTMLLTSCGGGDSDGGGSSSRPSTYYMDINMESAAREFQASYYPDVSISDEWTLDKSSKKHSDKKAAKLLDKELSGNKDLYDIIKHVNVSSA